MSNQSERNNILTLVDLLSAATEDKAKIKLAIESAVDHLIHEQENRLDVAISLLNKFSNSRTCVIKYVVSEGAKNKSKFTAFIGSAIDNNPDLQTNQSNFLRMESLKPAVENDPDLQMNRKISIQKIIDQFCDGNVAKFCAVLDKHPSYIYRLLRDLKESNSLKVTTKMSKLIEEAFKLPKFYLDTNGISSDQSKTYQKPLIEKLFTEFSSID